MEITIDEKNHLVEQIENSIGQRPVFYLKFCSCQKFAEDVCCGNLYGNTAEYFRRKEIETGERGQGDKLELISSIEFENIKIIDDKTGEIFLTAPKGISNTKFDNDDLIPIVSFVGIPLNEMKIISIEESYADFKFPFTDEEYKIMTERFGEYCVLINGIEIEERISTYSNKIDFKYIFDKVIYCDQNSIDRIKSFYEGSENRFLYKNSDLNYQREYRLALAISIPEDNFIRLGKFETAKIIKSNDLNNLIMRISYTLNY